MRGKLINASYSIETPRITPADAGKTRRKVSMHGIGWDHPRGCGENMSDTELLAKALGSPPRMRGKPFSIFFASFADRITPADAGKTC